LYHILHYIISYVSTQDPCSYLGVLIKLEYLYDHGSLKNPLLRTEVAKVS